VKKAVNVPVMMAFRLFLPDIPEKAIADGAIDFWEACRPMIADPELPRKAAEGKEAEIIPCIACNLCFSRLYYHQPIMCTVRPSLGHEKEEPWGYRGFAQAPKRKRIGVVGGGPAGLQYAAVAARKGHDVFLWDTHTSLGGSILLASQIDRGEDELLRPIRYLEGECRKAGVEIGLGQECTPEMLRDRSLDVVTVATGARFKTLPAIPSLTPDQIIAQGKKPGEAVLIVGGDGVGLAVAVYLLHHGAYHITLIEESGKLGRDVSPFYLWRFLKLFRERGVTFLTRAHIAKGPGKTLSISSPKGEKMIEVDDVVVALRQARDDVRTVFADCAPVVYVIGDARRPRRLHNAIHEAYRSGMQI
jgi:2,4-dienoyl-CoA reductase (NADPH2)